MGWGPALGVGPGHGEVPDEAECPEIDGLAGPVAGPLGRLEQTTGRRTAHERPPLPPPGRADATNRPSTSARRALTISSPSHSSLTRTYLSGSARSQVPDGLLGHHRVRISSLVCPAQALRRYPSGN